MRFIHRSRSSLAVVLTVFVLALTGGSVAKASWTISYDSNDANVDNYVTVNGVGAYLNSSTDPDDLNLSFWGSIFHPKVSVSSNMGSTAVFYPTSGYTNQLIYTPILIDRGSSWSLWYGGWDMNNEPWGSSYRGAADKCYSTVLTDYSLADWSAGTRYLNVLSGYYDSPSIPQLYHTNDPSIVKVDDDEWYIYFEMETQAELSGSPNYTLDNNPRNWTYPGSGENGVFTHMICRLESSDGGWNYQNTEDEYGLVKKADAVNISGITGADYVYYQIAWPSVVRLASNDYRMYFNAFPKPAWQVDPDDETVQTAETWEDWNNWQNITEADGPTPNHSWSGSLLYATSTNGVDFTYQGEVTDENSNTFWCANPDVKKIPGRNQLMITFNGGEWQWGTRNPQTGGQWSTCVAYINTATPMVVRYIDSGASAWNDEENVAFEPPIFDSDYDDVTPQWITRANGNIIGIAHGEWDLSEPYGYLAAAFLQKTVRIVDSSSTVVAAYQTSASHDSLQVAHNSWWYTGAPWITIANNEYDHNDSVYGKVQVYDIDGTFLCETGLRTIYPGDVYTVSEQ